MTSIATQFGGPSVQFGRVQFGGVVSGTLGILFDPADPRQGTIVS